MKCSVHDLARLITQDLASYTEEVEAAVEETITQVADDALQAIKSSPSIQHMDGYKNSFRIKNIYKSRGKTRGYCKLAITNLDYQISHLLEKGHLMRNGGRTRAYPHWVNGQKVADTLPDRIKATIQKAGK